MLSDLEKRTLKLEWVSGAKCAGMPTADWYPVRNKETYGPIARKVKGICRGLDGKAPCSMQKECLLWSFIGNEDCGEDHGIWGGYSHRERNVIQRRATKARMTIEKYVESMP